MKNIIPALIFIPAVLFGGDFTKVGTAAAQFLKIGVGARGAAMGDAFVAVADNVDALYWNPAGITNIHSIALDVGYSQWFAEIAHNYAGFAVPLSEYDVIGISITGLSTPEQEVTTVEQPEGTGLYYKVSDLAIGLSYARVLTDRFSVGVTAKYIQQNAYNESASTFAIDFGTSLQTGFYGLAIGMAVTNFGGGLQLEGRDLISISDINKSISGEYNPTSNLSTEQWPLPLNFRVGVALDIVGKNNPVFISDEHRFTLAVDGNHPNDNAERANIGGEYGWNEILFLRAGYKINYDAEKWTFGAGLKSNISDIHFTFDYALVDYNALGKVSRFSVGIKF
ncbi:MAG: PorV/PorQ family protein [Ignavibacteria bacterium]